MSWEVVLSIPLSGCHQVGGKLQSEKWKVRKRSGVLCVFCCIMKQQKNQKIRKE